MIIHGCTYANINIKRVLRCSSRTLIKISSTHHLDCAVALALLLETSHSCAAQGWWAGYSLLKTRTWPYGSNGSKEVLIKV